MTVDPCPTCGSRPAGRRPDDLTDIDTVAVDRAVTGGRTPLNHAERIQAVVRLTRQGYKAPFIAEQLGCATQTVHKDRATHRRQERTRA